MEPATLTAFLIGFLGSTHCVGMCGGIVGALNAGTGSRCRVFSGRAAYSITYNLGRITSYTIAGALAALIAGILSQAQLQAALPIGQSIAAAVMIALGLYFIGWSRPILILETAGSRIWRQIEPLGRSLLPARTPLHAYGLGLVWGWLPCGLVYSALALAAASGSPASGIVIMLSFGLGTLPMLLLMGAAADAIISQVRKPILRQIVGVSLMLLGVFSLVVAFSGVHHDHGHGGHSHAHSPVPPNTLISVSTNPAAGQ